MPPNPAKLFILLKSFSSQFSKLLYSPNCPETHSVDKDGLKLKDPPATSLVLGLKACTSTAWLICFFLNRF